MSKTEYVHPTFLSNEKHKNANFNTPHTYMVCYVFNGCLTLDGVRLIINDCAKQIVENYPERAEQVKKCVIRYNHPLKTEYDNDTPLYRSSMNYCNIFFSDWEIGNAFCGFNFNGTMRRKLVKTDEIGEDESEEISLIAPLEDNEIKTYKKKYKRYMNTISEAKAHSISIDVVKDLNNKECVDLIIEEIYSNACDSVMNHNNYVYILKACMQYEAEKYVGLDLVKFTIFRKVVKYGSKLLEIGNDKSIECLMSFVALLTFHNMFCRKSFCTFLQNFIENLNYESFETNSVKAVIKALAILKDYKPIKDTWESLYSKIGELIEDYGESYYIVNHKNILDHVNEIIVNESDLDFNDTYKIVKLDPICTPAAVRIPESRKRDVEEYCKERHYECENLGYTTIKSHKAYVKKHKDGIVHNILVTKNPVCDWVTPEIIRNRFKLFNSDKKDNQYPIVEYRDVQDIYRKFTVVFSPENTYKYDAGFSLLMLEKFSITHPNDPKIYTTVEFAYKRVKV